MYPAYCKRTPCSRSTRIQRDLRTLSSTSRGLTRSTQQILQDILTLLNKKSGSAQTRVETFEALLEKLPLWTQWDSREDDVVSSVSRVLNPGPSDKNHSVVEKELTDALMQGHGNIPWVSARDFDEDMSTERGRFLMLYTAWLNNTCSPEQKDCHVRDEQHHWVDDSTLRARINDGWHLHIPTRTLHQSTYPGGEDHLTTLTDLTEHDTPSAMHRVSLLDDIRSSPLSTSRIDLGSPSPERLPRRSTRLRPPHQKSVN